MARPQAPRKSSKQRMRGASRFKRSEAARLLRAATDAGLLVRGVEVDAATGRLRVLVGEPGKSDDFDNVVER